MTTQTIPGIPGHMLTFTLGERPYIHGQVLPLLTGTCECGGWTRESHRFNAGDDEIRDDLAADHKVHATRLTTDVARWPSDANHLHPLLGARWHGDLTEGSEHRRRGVPLEAGGLAPGTTYVQLVEAIATEVRVAVDADSGNGVPLALAPRLAAAKALLQQLDRNFPKVKAWCVQVCRANDPESRAWVHRAFHTQEEAEAALPGSLRELNKDRYDPDSPHRFLGKVVFGPTDLYRLRLPGAV